MNCASSRNLGTRETLEQSTFTGTIRANQAVKLMIINDHIG
jgi:hypothetical protein